MRSIIKPILRIILVALIIVCIVFWGSMGSACILMALILGFPIFLFNRVADNDFKDEFDRGKNVEGWNG